MTGLTQAIFYSLVLNYIENELHKKTEHLKEVERQFEEAEKLHDEPFPTPYISYPEYHLHACLYEHAVLEEAKKLDNKDDITPPDRKTLEGYTLELEPHVQLRRIYVEDYKAEETDGFISRLASHINYLRKIVPVQSRINAIKRRTLRDLLEKAQVYEMETFEEEMIEGIGSIIEEKLKN